jgi:uncharacterized protein (DUF1015 family)
VASVPYDVVTAAEARDRVAGNEFSFLRVLRPEVDLPPEIDPYDDRVYAQAKANLDRLIERGILARDETPSIYLYRQVMNHEAQIGVVCSCHLDDYANDVIKKHEKTRPDKEDDRTRHVLAVNANTGPVFMTYRDDPIMDDLIERGVNRRPVYHFDADDGVTHTVWVVDDADEVAAFVEAFGRIPCAYVADGHHRSASAARAGATLREANPDHDGSEEYNWFLSVLFPAEQLRILPYHRVVRDLGGRSVEETLDLLRGAGTLTPTDDPNVERPGVFCLLVGDAGWHRLELDPGSIDRSDPVASLDVALLHERVLAPVFGIGDERTDPRIDFVGGIRGTEELERRVAEGTAAAAISLHATSIEQLLAVADAGLVMPPKSTWFEPKLRSGLFVHELS